MNLNDLKNIFDLYAKSIVPNVGIGTNNPLTVLQVNSTGSIGRGITSAQFSSDNYSGVFSGAKARGTPSSPTIVANADFLATFNSLAFDGVTYQNAGYAAFQVNGTPSSGSVPTDFVVYTGTSTGSVSEKMRVTSGGSVGIGTTGPVALLDVNGTTKLGAAGVAVTNMGACTVATQTYTANTPRNGTCTGMPATAAVAVNCSPGAALSAAGTVLARSTGAGNQVAITLSSTVTTVVMYCMWIQP